MTDHKSTSAPRRPPVRPEHRELAPIPPVPALDVANPHASTEYAAYRTELSNLRTDLSEHRTDLSEYRTDLSTGRTEMSSRRTGMSFQRTRMSADRTLMSIIRTALSLIGFGFTIYQFFSKLLTSQARVVAAGRAPRNFGLALVALGIFMLTLGIIYHLNYMKSLRASRKAMVESGLIFGESPYPVSLTLITACLLWLLGMVAIVSMTFNLGLLG